MRGPRRLLLIIGLAVAAAAGLVTARGLRAPAAAPGAALGREPHLRPDYRGVTVPPNLAPLRFVVAEPGVAYQVVVQAEAGRPLTVRGRSPRICLPQRPWRRLLSVNRGGTLTISVAVREAGGAWRSFAPITNRIAPEDIDPYLAYRLITPIYNMWSDVGLYQRDLRGFGERLVVHGRYFRDGCVNCHNFANHHTDTMAVGVRGKEYGNAVVIVSGGRAVKLDAVFAYGAWHPDGRLAAYSLNKVRQFFHPARADQKDVVDLDSDLVLYTVGSDVVTTAPALSEPDRLETYPTWSPDGRYLYFCSAPLLWKPGDTVPPPHYREVRYDLRRVPYDPRTGQWGAAETVLSAATTGKSLLLPRISPDGRFLLFCMCDYGCFPIYQRSSDLYLMDLATRHYRRLQINSDRPESWHCWSSNSRWIVFSSKREDGLFTRSYLSHVDESGVVSKPLVLPQADPTLYDRQLQTYSVPELTQEPVSVRRHTVSAAIRGPASKLRLPQISMTREKPGARPTGQGPWTEAPAH